jgi:hypothetical protein
MKHILFLISLIVSFTYSIGQDTQVKKSKIVKASEKINEQSQKASDASAQVVNQSQQAAANMQQVAANAKTVIRIFEPILRLRLKKKPATENANEGSQQDGFSQQTQPPVESTTDYNTS